MPQSIKRLCTASRPGRWDGRDGHACDTLGIISIGIAGMIHVRDHANAYRECMRCENPPRGKFRQNFLPREKTFSCFSHRIAMYQAIFSAPALALYFLYLSPSPHLLVFSLC